MLLAWVIKDWLRRQFDTPFTDAASECFAFAVIAVCAVLVARMLWKAFSALFTKGRD